MNKGDDPYEILGIPHDADEAHIKKAYFKLARQYHPDKQTTEEDKATNGAIFARISDAYDLLNDPVRRYDWRSANEGKFRSVGAAPPSRPSPQTTSRPARSSSYQGPTRSTAPPPSSPGYRASPMARRSPGAGSSHMRSRVPPNQPPHRGGGGGAHPNMRHQSMAPNHHQQRPQQQHPPHHHQPQGRQRNSWPEPRHDNNARSPFEVLGIHWNADRVEVISAYRFLAQKYHPSKQRSEEARMHAAMKMTEVTRAFEILKDPNKLHEWQMRCKGSPQSRASPPSKPTPGRRNPAARNSNGGSLGGSMHSTRNGRPLRPKHNEFRTARSLSPKGKRRTKKISVVEKLGLPKTNHGESPTNNVSKKDNNNKEEKKSPKKERNKLRINSVIDKLGLPRLSTHADKDDVAGQAETGTKEDNGKTKKEENHKKTSVINKLGLPRNSNREERDDDNEQKGMEEAENKKTFHGESPAETNEPKKDKEEKKSKKEGKLKMNSVIDKLGLPRLSTHADKDNVSGQKETGDEENGKSLKEEKHKKTSAGLPRNSDKTEGDDDTEQKGMEVEENKPSGKEAPESSVKEAPEESSPKKTKKKKKSKGSTIMIWKREKHTSASEKSFETSHTDEECLSDEQASPIQPRNQNSER
eukprot:scaffold1170_cov122-Cylindrotheca_fusiformis.AAC.10